MVVSASMNSGARMNGSTREANASSGVRTPPAKLRLRGNAPRAETLA